MATEVRSETSDEQSTATGSEYQALLDFGRERGYKLDWLQPSGTMGVKPEFEAAAGGLLLVTPGVITDLVGFALVVPLTRRWLAPRVLASLTGRLDPEAWKVDIGAPTRYQPSPRPVPDDKPSPFDHPVV